jgi:DNA uptake protein ComE-like DNA-binding protein
MNFKKYFHFNKEQRLGLVVLVFAIIASQLVYFYVDFSSTSALVKEDDHWVSLQGEVDSLKIINKAQQHKIYPFNPNFISDYKGYQLGMKTPEIDRLLAFRETNQYVNSAKEFQMVTKISDSLLAVMSPYFKFPDWVNHKKEGDYASNYKKTEFKTFETKTKTVIIDINQATKEDLIKVYGIGEAISERILKQKELLGGFVSMEQIQDIWGLSPEVIAALDKKFNVSNVPAVTKIDINNLSLRELANFPYFRYALAKEIVTYRSMNGEIKNIEDLTKIKGFPVDKIKFIALYLEF